MMMMMMMIIISLSGPTEIRIVLGLRKVTATRHLKADLPPRESYHNQSSPQNAEYNTDWLGQWQQEGKLGMVLLVL
jgi:hypothetical protein